MGDWCARIWSEDIKESAIMWTRWTSWSNVDKVNIISWSWLASFWCIWIYLQFLNLDHLSPARTRKTWLTGAGLPLDLLFFSPLDTMGSVSSYNWSDWECCHLIILEKWDEKSKNKVLDTWDILYQQKAPILSTKVISFRCQHFSCLIYLFQCWYNLFA